MRESPAFPIMRELLKRGAKLRADDPVAMPEAQRAFREPGVTFVENLESALVGIDAAVVVTPWRQFDKVPSILAERQPQPVFVDGRRAYDKRVLARYEGIGL